MRKQHLFMCLWGFFNINIKITQWKLKKEKFQKINVCHIC